ncbi:MAG: signal peptidase I [Candidatus Woykebacteria bacterium RBG_13_40_7b]|uniref:Signal peptidase I n=1 Tax=Candidatus Woykebacteria bacterium RBG_13_40_7b TaxID=1802594 RepID=A0A1G1W8G5_9BACT|nr:MAG: signal peptidase I [Candidatus Woykebacteria bacterium RBG_13_40_7b]
MVIVLVAIAVNIKLPQGYKLLVVQSGSMEPSIPVGSIVLTKPTADFLSPIPSARFEKGDVITYGAGNVFVSHRVEEVIKEEGGFFYKTKGDANKDVDQKLVAEKDALGKATLTVPYLGRFVNFAKTPLGFLLMIIIPSLYVIFSELLVIISELRKVRSKIPASGIALPVVLIFASGLYFINGTSAYFSATEQSNDNIFQAAPIFTNHVVISEVQIKGTTGNIDHDFIELYNPTNTAINLNGHRLVRRTGTGTTDVNVKIFNNSHTIPAHGFFLWASSVDSTFPSSIGANVSTTDGLGGNASVALRLGSLDTGTIIDALSWSNNVVALVEGSKFSSVPDSGQSIERKALSASTSTSMISSGADEFKGNGFDSDDNAADFILRPSSQPQNSSSSTETL